MISPIICPFEKKINLFSKGFLISCDMRLRFIDVFKLAAWAAATRGCFTISVCRV